MEDNLNDPYEYEVDLRDYINVIWEQKWLILAVFVVAVGLATGYSVTRPPIYRTQATLLITPRISEQIVSDSSDDGDGFTTVSLPNIVYETSALADDLLQKIISDLELKNSSGELTSVNSLEEKLSITIEMSDNSNRDQKMPLVTLEVKGSDPAKLQNIANKWAELFIQRNTDLFASETSRSFEFISRRFSKVEQELKTVEKEKLEFNKENPLQVLKSEVSVLKGRYENFLSNLEDKKATLAEKKARLDSLQKTLDEEPRFLELKRSIPSESLWNLLQGEATESGTESDAADGGDILSKFGGLKIKDQEINNLHFTLSRQKATVMADIASLEEEISYLGAKLEEFQQKINEKQAQIDQGELKLNRFERKLSQLTNTYNSLSSNLEEARIAKAEKESSIRMMENAVIPEKPLSSNTKQNVAVAGVLGLFIGVLVAFFRNYMEGYEEEKEEEEEESDD